MGVNCRIIFVEKQKQIKVYYQENEVGEYLLRYEYTPWYPMGIAWTTNEKKLGMISLKEAREELKKEKESQKMNPYYDCRSLKLFMVVAVSE